jgi:hypothetical protein
MRRHQPNKPRPRQSISSSRAPSSALCFRITDVIVATRKRDRPDRLMSRQGLPSVSRNQAVGGNTTAIPYSIGKPRFAKPRANLKSTVESLLFGASIRVRHL